MARYLLIGLLLAASSSLSYTEQFTCQNGRTPCALVDVVLESEEDIQEAEFPDTEDPLIIASGRIPNFTEELAEKLDHIEDITMNGIQLESVYVRPELTHLEAINNRITTLLVHGDRDRSYNLKTLNVTNNKLTDPSPLLRFKKLQILTLDGNELKTLHMDTFAGMAELRHLSVARNLLMSVESPNSIFLVKLRSLSLAHNRLMELAVFRWEFPSLEELDLRHNHLYMLEGALDQFQELQRVNLAGNFWKCDGLLEMTKPEQRLQLDKDAPGRCEGNLTEVQGICCAVDAASFLGNTDDTELGLFDEKWKQLRTLGEAMQKLNESLSENVQQVTNEVAEKEAALEERIKQLEEKQEELAEKMSEKETVAVEEFGQLREVSVDHKQTIRDLQNKQEELEEKLEQFDERFNSLQEKIDEKLTSMASVDDNLAELEQRANLTTFNAALAKLEGGLTQLESQQIKYHLFSIDLKSQLSQERARISQLRNQFDGLREELQDAQEAIGTIFRIVEEIKNEEP